jgi:hypothetical protein
VLVQPMLDEGPPRITDGGPVSSAAVRPVRQLWRQREPDGMAEIRARNDEMASSVWNAGDEVRVSVVQVVASTSAATAPLIDRAEVVRQRKVRAHSVMTVGPEHGRHLRLVGEVQHDSIAPQIDREKNRLVTVAGAKVLADRNGAVIVREGLPVQIATHVLNDAAKQATSAAVMAPTGYHGRVSVAQGVVPSTC